MAIPVSFFHEVQQHKKICIPFSGEPIKSRDTRIKGAKNPPCKDFLALRLMNMHDSAALYSTLDAPHCSTRFA